MELGRDPPSLVVGCLDRTDEQRLPLRLGAAEFDRDSIFSAEQLLAAADRALLRAKRVEAFEVRGPQG